MEQLLSLLGDLDQVRSAFRSLGEYEPGPRPALDDPGNPNSIPGAFELLQERRSRLSADELTAMVSKQEPAGGVVIYGFGGSHRYSVNIDGTIVFMVSHCRHQSCERKDVQGRARTLGFLVS